MMDVKPEKTGLAGQDLPIDCRGVRFARSHGMVLKGVDLTVCPGQIVGLLGKNGAGKSTLIQLLMGYLRPLSGQCRVYGCPSRTITPQIRERIGLLHEGFIQYDFLTIEQIEHYYRGFYSRWQAELFWALVERMQLPPRKTIARLSCGQRSQVTLGLLMAQRADLLILDDYSLGLDAGYRRLFLALLREYVDTYEAAVLLTSHVVGELERCLDRVVVLNHGHVLCNETLPALMASATAYRIDDPALLALIKQQVQGVLAVEYDGRHHYIYARLSPEKLKGILIKLGVAPETAANLPEVPVGLEDVFVAMTGSYG